MQLQLSDTFSISAILFFIRCPYPALAITFPHWSLLPFRVDPNKTHDLSIMVQHQHIPQRQLFSVCIYFVLATLKTPQVREKINQMTPCSCLLSLQSSVGALKKGSNIFCHPAGSQSRVVPFASCNWLMKVNLISSTSLQIPSNATIWCILSEDPVPSSWPSATKKRQLCSWLGTEMSCFKWSFSPIFLRLHRSDLPQINPLRINM